MFWKWVWISNNAPCAIHAEQLLFFWFRSIEPFGGHDVLWSYETLDTLCHCVPRVFQGNDTARNEIWWWTMVFALAVVVVVVVAGGCRWFLLLLVVCSLLLLQFAAVAAVVAVAAAVAVSAVSELPWAKFFQVRIVATGPSILRRLAFSLDVAPKSLSLWGENHGTH